MSITTHWPSIAIRLFPILVLNLAELDELD